jgi:prepilin-type N-terminal cleavage/methylation domain-containing protein
MKIENTCARKRHSRGFSLLELMIALLIASVLTAMALPQIKRGVYGYRLTAEVDMVTWAIQSTRFQALKDGYPYQVVFNHTANTYQIQNEVPPAATFSNVGSTVPLSGSAVTLNQDMTIQMKPNGSLSVTVGTPPLNVTYQGTTKQITVTNYGNLLVQ